jgi:hypothetical protein
MNMYERVFALCIIVGAREALDVLYEGDNADDDGDSLQ